MHILLSILWFGIFGFTLLGYIPQIHKIVKYKRATEVSIMSKGMFALSHLLLIYYNFNKGDYLLGSGYIISLILSAGTVLLCFLYREKKTHD